MKKFLKLKILAVLFPLYFVSVPAHADWGCEVLLCLANPMGATAASACVPPITRLWKELARKGGRFPVCNMGAGSNADAQHQYASAAYCPPQYIRWHSNGESPPVAYCMFSGAVTIKVEGAPFTRVWWAGNDQVTEILSQKAADTSGASQRFANDYAAWKVVQDAIEAQKAAERARCGGDC